MNTVWQLDGACCANGCCDGSSDEPCAHVDLAAKPAPQDESAAETAANPASLPAVAAAAIAKPVVKEAPKKTGYFGTSEEPKQK